MAERDIAIVVFDGFTDIDVFLPWDLLNRVEASGWSVHLLGDGTEARSATGLPVPLHGPLEQAVDCAAVIVTSGKTTRRLRGDAGFLGRLRVDPAHQLVGSMCSGALLLAAKGLLDGARATTYPTARELLEGYGVEVVEEPFVRHGNVATAAGCLAAQELCGWVIESLVGPAERARVIGSVQPVGRGLSFARDADAA